MTATSASGSGTSDPDPDSVPARDRLVDQLAFLVEADQLKTVLRQSLITDGSRRENSAEHSWHLALFALVLAEHADEPVDLPRVVTMLLLHDLVEIDAGDVFIYDDAARAATEVEEQAAAERLFALLPAEQGEPMRALWEEFEAKETADARFAAAVDRLQPLLLNLANEGETWRRHGITGDRVREVNSKIGRGSSRLWAHAQALLDQAEADGHLASGPGSAPSATADRE
jgi:putative hydrolases of HD superfamily